MTWQDYPKVKVCVISGTTISSEFFWWWWGPTLDTTIGTFLSIPNVLMAIAK